MGAAGLERRRFGLIRKTPVVVMSMNEAEEERLKETERVLTFGCGGGKELLRSYIRHLEKQGGRTLVGLSNYYYYS